MIEQYKFIKYELKPINHTESNQWYYKIYTDGCHPCDEGIIVSKDFFDTEQEARFAAIGYISLIPSGEM
jgi:hypothetical protein